MADVKNHRAVVLKFLKHHTLAVVATTHPNGTPEAAVVDFSVRDDLEIVFDTFDKTRKYENLLQNPAVAFVVGWESNITVQYEGRAQLVQASDVARYQRDHIEHVPEEREFIERGAILFKVRPQWIRYSDFTSDPPTIVELAF